MKPLNFVRVGDRWKLIDLDTAAQFAQENTGFKCSSAYAPPEAVEIFEEMASASDSSGSPVKRARIKRHNSDNSLVAHASFDICK